MANMKYDYSGNLYTEKDYRNNDFLTEQFIKQEGTGVGARDIPKDIHDLNTVNIDRIQLIQTLKYDFDSFIKLILHEEEGIDLGVPPFHKYGFKKMTDIDIINLVIAWPRDHAKTTLLKIAILWLFIYTPFRFAMYVCHTNKKAANALADLVNMMKKESVVGIYGVPKIIKAQASTGSYLIDWCDKRIILEAVGVGQDVRGTNIDNQRPQILALDDVEKAEEGEENKMGYEGISDWFFATLRKCVDRRGHVIRQIGNLVAEKSLLYDNLTSDYWVSTRLSAITKEGKPLWPARWTLAQLKLDLLEYIEKGKMGIWMSEMLNMPLNESNAIIRSGDLLIRDEVTPDNPDILMKCITVDPAITKSATHADNAVVFVHVYLNGAWQVGEIFSAKGQSVYDLYYKIIELASKWRITLVGIETEGYQEALRQVCEQKAIEMGINTMHFVPLKTNKKSKASRIIAWAGMLKAKSYALSFNYLWLFEKLVKYNPDTKNNDDDEPDAGSYILHMIDYYGHLMAGIVDDRQVAADKRYKDAHRDDYRYSDQLYVRN